MIFGRWVLGAVAAGLAFGAVSAQAAPMPVVTGRAPTASQTVQFYYYNDEPPAYYAPPPRRYYGPPRERYWERRAPPPAAYYAPPRYGFYDKDTVKDYRRAQKEIYKERVRAWNRANGY